MDVPRIDRLGRALAARRSRRATLAAGGAGLAAVLGPAARHDTRAVQDGTPVAIATPPAEDGDRTFFMFVQTFHAGTLAPKPGEDGVYLLTLSGGAGQTVYFSDRPQRVVGSVPTQVFLDGLGFTPANPPNAALVAQVAGGEEVVVVELFNPVSDGAAGTLTYEARVLAEYAGDGLAHLAARRTDSALPDRFGPASLFIDDCDDDTFECVPPPPNDWNIQLLWGPQCWSWFPPRCIPCDQDADLCNAHFPTICNGDCIACKSGDVFCADRG